MSDLSTVLPYREPLEIQYHPVAEVLPSHFQEDYPNLILFLTKYYDAIDEQGTNESILHELFNLSDLSSVDPQFLGFLELQFLLGRTNFNSDASKRAALKQNSSLYRSKGSKFSLEQFFRMFFEMDAEVVYTKENMFIIGESNIGPDSLRYVQDDKLYQTFALLIKTERSLDQWKESYKLFVHPAGMYLGAQVTLICIGDLETGNLLPDVIESVDNPKIISENIPLLSVDPANVTDLSGIVPFDATSDYRVGLVNTNRFYAETSIEDINGQYDDISEIMTSTSPTMDNDSDTTGGTITMSNIHETMDQDFYVLYDSDE